MCSVVMNLYSHDLLMTSFNNITIHHTFTAELFWGIQPMLQNTGKTRNSRVNERISAVKVFTE